MKTASLFLWLLSSCLCVWAQPTVYSSDNNAGITRSIYVSGNSLMAGTGGTPMQALLQNKYTERLVSSFAIGGQTAQQIAARQGGLPVYITVSGNQVVGANATACTVSTQLLSTPADQSTRTLSGMIAGNACILTRTVTNSAEVYTIQLVQPSWVTTPIPASTQFFNDEAYNHRHEIQVIEMGRNNVPTLTGVDTLVYNCINYLPRPRRFVILGVLNAYNENPTTGIYFAILAHNARLQAAYPKNYVSFSSPTQAEMTTVGYSPTAQDLTDIGNSVWPTGLRADATHLNTLGYQIVANRIEAVFKQLGL